MEINNLSKKSLLVVFVFAIFINSVYSVDVIDMRNKEDVSKNNLIEKEINEEQNNQLVLFNNYIDVINNQNFVKVISPYYKNIVFNIDDYNLTFYFNDSGVEKIIDGSVNNPDLYLTISDENVRYIINNWYSMNTFDKIKYIINIDGIQIGEIIKLSGIAMSLLGEK